MKRKLTALTLAAACALPLAGCARGPAAGDIVNVYNWGEFIDTSIFDDFTALTGIKVNYQTFDSNESLYGKLAGGASGYDVIIPSDYMVAQMIEEDMLAPLNFEHIPNFSDIDPALLNPEYDPENLYSVPYMYGVLGIIYNQDMVPPEEDMETWDVLWNENYARDILMFDNCRDSIGIALKKLGYSYNTTDPREIIAAADLLVEQKPIVQAYVMDRVFQKLEGSNTAIGAYYYGDYLTMAENNPKLKFAIPREGTNCYVDAMCIPKSSEHKENAEAFINFMCSTEVGLANVEETWFSTPLLSVRALLPPEAAGDPYAYPNAEFMARECETYSCLPPETRQLYNDQWLRLLNSPDKARN